MPPPGVALDRLGFLTIGLFDGDNQRRGEHGLGALGRRAPDELPDQQRGPGGGVSGLRRDPAVAHPLPFSFSHEDYVQILSDMAAKLGPALGWRPVHRGPAAQDTGTSRLSYG